MPSKPSRPEIRFAFFSECLPRGKELPPGTAHESFMLEAPDPKSDKPFQIFFIVTFRGIFRRHKVDCRVLSPSDKIQWAGKATSPKRKDANKVWSSIFPLSFLPLELGAYITEIVLDGEVALARTIGVVPKGERIH